MRIKKRGVGRRRERKEGKRERIKEKRKEGEKGEGREGRGKEHRIPPTPPHQSPGTEPLENLRSRFFSPLLEKPPGTRVCVSLSVSLSRYLLFTHVHTPTDG